MEKRVEEFQETFLVEEEASTIELNLTDKYGNDIPVEVSGALIKDNVGRAVGTGLIFRDISERKRLEEMKTDFISNISHELRTPLTSIKGSIDNLLDGIPGELNEAQKEYLSIVNDESDRLVRLIGFLASIFPVFSSIRIKVSDAIRNIA